LLIEEEERRILEEKRKRVMGTEMIARARAAHAAKLKEKEQEESKRVLHPTPTPPQPSSPRRGHPPFDFQTCTECGVEDPMEEDICGNCQADGDTRRKTARIRKAMNRQGRRKR
jgi:hypothetical protein